MSNAPTTPGARGAGQTREGPAALSPAVHSLGQQRRRLAALGVVILAMISICPWLTGAAYRGSADAHSTMEVVGALCGLVAGMAFINCFYAFGDRFHLFVGLAFFINGAEDIVHGAISFRNVFGLPEQSVVHAIPATYVSGRMMLSVLLLLAPFAPRWLPSSSNPRRETFWTSAIVVAVTMFLTALAFYSPLPRVVFPERLISRPLDFLSALVLLAAMAGFVRKYRHEGDLLVWWLLLSMGINLAGQVLMSFSKAMDDAPFDVAHVCKVFGYFVPLVGFSFYQLALLKERKRAQERTMREGALLEAANRVLQRALTCDTNADIAHTCLAEAQRLTGSRFGFISEVNAAGREDTIALSDPGWEACRIPRTNAVMMIKDMAIHGLYGRPILDRRSIICNAPASHPNSVGIPQGHPPLTSFLGVPWKQGDAVLGAICLANKPSGYDQVDQQAVETLAVAFVEALLRKRAEEALRQAHDWLEVRVQERTEDLTRSNAELEQFAHVASHDLQEPLRAVSSFVQLLQRRYQGKLDAKADEYIKFAVDGAQRMQQLINDLLAYSRVGTRGESFTPVACNQVVDEALKNLRTAIAREKAIVTRDELPTVHADRTQLLQVFQNLIANAVKFHGTQAPCVHVSAAAKDDQWLFSVRDNGIGIDAKYADRIFVLFQRLNTRKDYPGTGIGLTICKRIVERHGGKTWFESTPGQGTTFHFTLPLKEAVRDPAFRNPPRRNPVGRG